MLGALVPSAMRRNGNILPDESHSVKHTHEAFLCGQETARPPAIFPSISSDTEPVMEWIKSVNNGISSLRRFFDELMKLNENEQKHRSLEIT